MIVLVFFILLRFFYNNKQVFVKKGVFIFEFYFSISVLHTTTSLNLQHSTRTNNLWNFSEIEAKFIQNRIQSVEKSLSEISAIFSQYSRKAGSLRDKNGEISKAISNYAETEHINKSLSNGLENFADSLRLLTEFGDKRVQYLETKVVTELAKYKEVCKHAKEEVKEIYSAREKELSRKKQLFKIKEKNPKNRQQIVSNGYYFAQDSWWIFFLINFLL